MARRSGNISPPRDDVQVNRNTPMPTPVMPPRHDRAIEINGTWQELLRLTRRAIVSTVIVAVTLFLMIILIFGSLEVSGLIFVECWLLVALLISVRRPLAVVRAWWIVTHHPWCAYRARVSGTESLLSVDLSKTNASKNDPTVLISLRPRATKRQREELMSGAFANVWFVGGDSSRNGLIVPSGGGIVIFVRRRSARASAATAASRAQKRAQALRNLTPRQQAAAQRRNARAAARLEKAAAKAKAAMARRQAKAAQMTPEQRARVARKLESQRAATKAAAAKRVAATAKRAAAVQAAAARAATPRRSGVLRRRGQSLGQFLPKD